MVAISKQKKELFEVVDVENINRDTNTNEPPKDNKNKNKTQKYHHKRHTWETRIEWALYNSRWLLSLMYICLIAVLFIILIKFIWAVGLFAVNVWGLTDNEWIMQVLELLDLTLLANLVLIVAFSGYENFVSRIDPKKKGEDRLKWMGKLDFSGLKLKIIGSIVAISIIELLQDFLNATSHVDPNFEFWRIVLHIVFVVTGVAFAAMELMGSKEHELKEKEKFYQKQKELL